MKQPFAIDLKQVVRLLSSKLYSTPNVVVRELVQNAYDAIRQRYKAADRQGRISFTVHPGRRTLVVADNGIGMDHNDLTDYLSTLFKGIKELQDSSDNAHPTPIGEFGIGFLSVFFIADKVELRTRKVDAAEGYVWVSTGVEGWECAVDTNPLQEPGTQITLHIGHSALEFTDPETIRTLVAYYCDFLDCPIYVNDSTEPINGQLFLWEIASSAGKGRWILDHLSPVRSSTKLG
jgi:molecular chaperone HtpG